MFRFMESRLPIERESISAVELSDDISEHHRTVRNCQFEENLVRLLSYCCGLKHVHWVIDTYWFGYGEMFNSEKDKEKKLQRHETMFYRDSV